jgi:predicted CoA-binding protein
VSGRIVEDEAEVVAIARDMRTVAVVGIKDDRDPDAPAFSVPEMMKALGVRIIGVNPTIPSALGEPTLGSVAALPPGVDVLDVFRRPDAIPALADEILALPPERRPPVVWLQSGIRHDAAAARLAEAGIRVVQDHCLGVYTRRARFRR